MAELAAKIYACAFFDAVKELPKPDDLDKAARELIMLDLVFRENPDYLVLLSSPVIEASEKKDLLKQAFSQGVSPYLLNLLFLLCDNQRMAVFPQLCSIFAKLYEKEQNIVEVTVYTAVQMTDELSQRLREKLSGRLKKQVKLKEKIDPSLLGGVKLVYDGKEFDSSVKAKLSQIRKDIRGRMI